MLVWANKKKCSVQSQVEREALAQPRVQQTNQLTHLVQPSVTTGHHRAKCRHLASNIIFLLLTLPSPK